MDPSSVVFSSTFRISSILMTGLVALTSSNRPRSQKDNIRWVTRHSNLWSHGFSRCPNSFSVGLCRGQCQHATLAWSSEKAYVTCENVRFALHLSTCVEMSTKSCNFCFQTCKVTRIMQEKCVQLLHSLASAYPQGRRRSCPSGSPQKKSLHIHMKAKRIRMAAKKRLAARVHLSMESQEKCTATCSCSN